jgi:hypothetical protein
LVAARVQAFASRELFQDSLSDFPEVGVSGASSKATFNSPLISLLGRQEQNLQADRYERQHIDQLC